MARVSFYSITQSEYDAIVSKDANGLYFISDKNVLFKGSKPYSYPVTPVTNLPSNANAVIGMLYIDKTNKVSKTYDGTNWHVVGPLIAASISGSGDVDSAASTKAVVDHVAAEIAKVNASAQQAVTGVTIANKKLAVTVNNGTPVETAITGFFDGATYASATGVLKFTTNGGTEVSINLPKEDFLQTAVRHEVTSGDLSGADASIYTGCAAGDLGILLTMVQGAKLFVKLTDLVDTYTAKALASNDTVAVTVNGYEISAQVRVSATGGNKLTINADGLFVAAESIGTGKTGVVLTADAAGKMSDSGKTIGGAALNASPTATVLATEIAVKTYADGKMTKLTAAASNKVLIASATGDAADSGKTIGSGTLGATPNANTLATELGVSNCVDTALEWKTA